MRTLIHLACTLSLAGLSSAQTLVKDIYPPDAPGTTHSYPEELTALRDRLLFSAANSAGRELWISDGSDSGTEMLLDIHPTLSSNPRDLVLFQDEVLFFADDATGPGLWRTDGTESGTTLVLGLPGNPDHLTVMDDVLVFYVGAPAQELWRSDGTAAGTTSFAPVGELSADDEMFAFDGAVYFSPATPALAATDDQLWKTDGTLGGTGLVKTIDASVPASPRQFIVAGERLYFVTSNSEPVPVQLWTTDGTESGTTKVANLNAGNPILFPNNLAALDDGTLLFTAASVFTTWNQLWRTDGTVEGTEMLYEPSFGSIQSLVALGDKAYFAAYSVLFFTGEMWETDGTAGGTSLSHFVSNSFLLPDNNLHAVDSGSLAVWSFDNLSLASGVEAFITDGAGTQLLADVNPGTAGSYAGGFTRVGARVFFHADDGVHDTELHAFSIADWNGWVAEPFGRGCGLAGEPSLDVAGEVVAGSALQFGVEDVAPLSPLLLYFGASTAALPIGDCSLYLPNPILLTTSAADASGSWQLAATVPSVPELLGLPIYLQALALVPGGPIGGLGELTNGFELIIAAD